MALTNSQKSRIRITYAVSRVDEDGIGAGRRSRFEDVETRMRSLVSG